VAHSAATGVTGLRQFAIVAFIVIWVTVQVAVPLIQKFELDRSGLPYRYTRYSWAMFSRLVPRYEVSLYRTRGTGDREQIPDISRYVSGYRSPDPMPKLAIYTSEAEVLGRYRGLIETIARERRDGYTYVAAIRWTAHPPGTADRSELRVDATP
jgi:hypothetical protein